MKKYYVIFVFIFLLLLSACQNEEGGNEKEVEKKEAMNPAEYLNVLIDEEKNGDGKSVYWNGKEAIVKDDPYDVKDIDDGRFTIQGKK